MARSPRPTGEQRAARGAALAVAAAVAALLLGFGLMARSTQGNATDALDERFQTRAALTARFVRTYVDDAAQREPAQADHVSEQVLGPLGAYLDSAVPIEGGGGYLVDASGDIVAGDRGAGTIDASNLSEGVNVVDGATGSITAVVAAVPGAPWRVVLTAPTAALHAPLGGAGRWMSFALLAALAVCGLATVILVLRLGEARTRATELAETDSLTGLANRRAMDGVLERAIAHSRRHEEPMALCLVDLDRFKAINDTYGHHTGDAVLRAAAAVLRRATRAEDAPGRWGGEEFVVVVPGTDATQAMTVAERVRAAIRDMAPPSLTGADPITVSIGVAVLAGPDDDADRLLARADGALYLAKEQGRDRVVLASPDRRDPIAASTRTLVSAHH